MYQNEDRGLLSKTSTEAPRPPIKDETTQSDYTDRSRPPSARESSAQRTTSTTPPPSLTSVPSPQRTGKALRSTTDGRLPAAAASHNPFPQSPSSVILKMQFSSHTSPSPPRNLPPHHLDDGEGEHVAFRVDPGASHQPPPTTTVPIIQIASTTSSPFYSASPQGGLVSPPMIMNPPTLLVMQEDTTSSDDDNDPDHQQTVVGSIKHFFVSNWSTFATATALSVHYTASDISKRPRNACIGVLSIFLIVFFSGLVLTAVSKTPYVLLRFAELNVGEMDILLLAGGSSPFMDYSTLGPQLEEAWSVAGTAPRWLAKGQVQSMADVLEAQEFFLRTNRTKNVSTISTNVALIDSEKEKRVGIGRAWPYREIGYAETQMFHSALDFINVRGNAGKRIRLFIDVRGLLAQQEVSLSTITIPIANPLAALNPAVNITVGNLTISAAGILQFLNNITVGGGGAGAPTLLQVLDNATSIQIDPLTLATPETFLTVTDPIVASEGKYPASLGNMLLMDYRQFVDMLIDQSCINGGTLNQAVVNPTAALNPLSALGVTGDSLRSMFNLSNYALLIVAMFNNRFETYYKGQEARTIDLIRFSNAIFLRLGIFFGGDVQYPLATALDGFYFLQLFLDSIFTSVVAVIIVLGMLLVYVLLMTNAEERQFELAMIRAEGMSKGQVLHLMCTQAASFVIPGVVIGICVLLFTNAMIEIALSSLVKTTPQTSSIPSGVAIFATVLGLVMPVIASWFPVQSALATSLRDALDVYRQKFNEIRVTMIRLAELGLEPWETLLGWFLVIAGFVVYYLIPLSFIFNNFGMFFLLLNLILLTMLFGLCMMTYSLQGVVEFGALWLLLWGKELRLRMIIVKNLGAHKDRNSKAFMMFTISVACIIFGGVLFTLLASSLSQTVEIFNGADISLQSVDSDFPLEKPVIDKFLNEQKGTTVSSWSYATYPIRNYPQFRSSESVGNIVGFPTRTVQFVAVDESFLDTVYERFVLITETDSNFPYGKSSLGLTDVVRSLYNSPPVGGLAHTSQVYSGFPPNTSHPDVQAKYDLIIPCIMASTSKEIFGLGAGDYGVLTLNYMVTGRRTVRSQFLFQPRALVRKLSGFIGISSQQFGFPAGAVIVPIPVFSKLLSPNTIDFEGADLAANQLIGGSKTYVRYQRLFIRLVRGLSDKQRTDFVNNLQSHVNPYYHVPFDTQEIKNSIQIAADLIIYFFYFVSGVCLLLDTFMLWLTFVSNVKLHSWNFGVLRSLGFSSKQLIRSYIYEALSIVLAGFFIGTIIGVLVAITLSLQMLLFLDLPLMFAFPVGLFFFLFGLALVSAVVGSVLPSRDISMKPVASVLKKSD